MNLFVKITGFQHYRDHPLFHNLKFLDTVLGVGLQSIAQRLLFLFLGILVAITFLAQAFAVPFPYLLDYGEAPLVDQAMRLANGLDIYRADLAEPPYTISNYSPVYVAFMALFLKRFGPVFWVGRLISALSAWGVAILIGCILYRFTQDRQAAWLGGLFFFSIPYVVQWSGFARIDLLALFLSMAGLACLVRPFPPPVAENSRTKERLRFLAGGLFILLAIYTRQSYALAAPMAAFFGLWFAGGGKNWRENLLRACALVILVGGLGLLFFALLNGWTRGGFYFNIVTSNVNEFGIERLTDNLRRLWRTLPVLLGMGGFSMLLSPCRRRIWAFTTPYLVGAALSALTIGKIGSNINYFLELCVALSLALGSVVAWSRQSQPSHFFRAAILGFLIFQCVRALPVTLNEYIRNIEVHYQRLPDLERLENLVVEADGLILADEDMGMLTLNNRPLYLQPFEVTQLAAAGVWDQEPLLESIRNHEFEFILIHYWEGIYQPMERWTPEMFSAIFQYYTYDQVLANTRVYRPIGVP